MTGDALRDFDTPALTARLTELGEPPFRARQIAKWIYAKRADSFDTMHNIPKTTRALLQRSFVLRKLAIRHQLVAQAGDAVKFGLELPESSDLTECVLLYDRTRRTLCLSSQQGCALGCKFCATATMGLVRNLTQEEIIGQMIAANDYLASQGDNPVSHVVFMGMGEALANFETFCSVCRVITCEEGFLLSPRRITVSTAGVVPDIERLLLEGPPVQLAISLNEYNDQRRSAIMPVNRLYPLASLIEAARRYSSAPHREVTFEYVVRRGENDTPQALSALTKLLHGITCRVNCIPLNDTSRECGTAPEFQKVQEFAAALHDRGIHATVRRSRGSDISGACGQLCTPRNKSHQPPAAQS